MIKSLEDFRVYNLAMKVGEEVWEVVSTWDYFQKDTVGKQLVRAVDSIAANLSEGLGRYHLKETKNFSYYSRGSLFETKTWITKANNRKLIDQDNYKNMLNDLELIGKMLNSYINTLDQVNEPQEDYISNPNPEFLSPESQVPNA
ncbi:MAG TPA: four helix bundle protein [Cyclobacteriaceae bacterium]